MGVWLPTLPERFLESYCASSMMRIYGLSYGDDRPVKEWNALCGMTRPQVVRDGINGKRIITGWKKGGHDGFLHDHSSFEAILHYLEQGIAPMVDWYAEDFRVPRTKDKMKPNGGEGHYSGVMDLTRKHIVLRDPRCKRPLEFKHEDFLRNWFDFDDKYIKNPADLILRRMIILYPAGRSVEQYRGQADALQYDAAAANR